MSDVTQADQEFNRAQKWAVQLPRKEFDFVLAINKQHYAAGLEVGIAQERERCAEMLEALREAEAVLGFVYAVACMTGLVNDPSDRVRKASAQIRAALAAAKGDDDE